MYKKNEKLFQKPYHIYYTSSFNLKLRSFDWHQGVKFPPYLKWKIAQPIISLRTPTWHNFIFLYTQNNAVDHVTISILMFQKIVSKKIFPPPPPPKKKNCVNRKYEYITHWISHKYVSLNVSYQYCMCVSVKK